MSTDAQAAAVIQVHGLRLGYGAHTVIEAVDLRVQAGEFWFLLGQNGTGKTTLLKALLGLLLPQAGEIHMHPTLARRDRIGFVPQRCDLNASLPTTVREFVLLGLVGLRTRRKDRAERLAWSLEKVGLEGMAKKGYWSLSEGQRQRALVARALARRPAVLVMDEPTIGLDPAAETTLFEYLSAVNQDDRLTILCVSHDLATAARQGSHVALFHKAHVQAGPAREILTPTNLQRIYGVGLDVQWQTDNATSEVPIDPGIRTVLGPFS